MKVTIEKSKNPKKKYTAKTDNRTIHFGAKGYQDFTTHGDENRRENYIKRHGAQQDWRNIMTPGFMSRYVLWEEKSVKKAVEKLNKKYKHVDFVLR